MEFENKSGDLSGDLKKLKVLEITYLPETS